MKKAGCLSVDLLQIFWLVQLNKKGQLSFSGFVPEFCQSVTRAKLVVLKKNLSSYLFRNKNLKWFKFKIIISMG